ncbi:class II aldolase/adducin family protein [Pararhizobium sp. IMCC21322]|uniref:class II aldolase/adducin family protein n=1 Tax=Pararhizobium sp. IMCC21322 TaxID=3067903 RepID=UPI002740BAD4|nr:class II aldolase/adducin family protein [Pararhizobium sp. IMCC21322]
MTRADPHDLPLLRTWSRKFGSNPLMVQGAGGNTSIKEDGVMWIKASGTQLSEALDKDIFVPVDLTTMIEETAAHPERADEPQRYLLQAGGLKPSIETCLHAAFPKRVVLHVHCVNTIALAIRTDAVTELSTRLTAFNWAYVDYAKPGAQLAKLVRKALNETVEVIILGNHGLLVAGDTVEEAAGLIEQVSSALHADAAPEQPVDLARLQDAAGAYFEPAEPDDQVHQLAMTSARIEQAIGGTLYPDHVIFCGIGAHATRPGETADAYCVRAETKPHFLIVPDAGVLWRKDITENGRTMTRCLSDVMVRVPATAKLNYFTQAQDYELLDWDAETYRQQMNA